MSGIYIHIPFCKQACNYCNFYFSTSLGNKEKFVQALIKEIDLTRHYFGTEKIETLYFGGGTPSLLSADDFKKIIDALNNTYDLGSLKEFTIEANPDDLDKKKTEELSELKSMGLNRFSIGVQSFFDADLEYMNRAHNAREAVSSIKRIQDEGFENITIDLIYGTPGMNNDRWMKNLQTAFDLNVPHISSYALTVEPKTALDKKIRKGEAKPVDEEQSSQQFQMLMTEMLTHGFEQYEISNFARDKKYALHNSNYWLGKKYLGLGPSAHSFDGASRRWNVANNISYIKSISESMVPFEEEILSEAQKINEKIMISLRTKWGLNLAEVESQRSEEILHNLLQIDAEHYNLLNGILKLTDEGKFFADRIAAKLFVDDL